MSISMNSNTLRSMVEVGFLSVGQGFTREAQIIVTGLKALRPDDATPYMIQAFDCMNGARYDEAVTILRDQALFRSPDDDLIKAFLAFNLIKLGLNSQADSFLSSALGSTDLVAKNLAKEVVNFSKQ